MTRDSVHPTTERPRRATSLVAAALAVVFAIAAVIYLSVSRQGPRRATPPPAPKVVQATAPIAAPFVMFRSLAPDDFHGRVAMVAVGGSDVNRYVAALSCARVHYAGGTGICMVEEAVGKDVKHVAFIFDSTFTRGKRIELAGVPIRGRVSPDGRRAAITIFREAHSPGGAERVATESFIVDVTNGRIVADLREFALDPGSEPPPAGPLDFSSVAFGHDGDRFFATLTTTAQTYLAAGSMAARRLTIARTGVANEAMSPDGKRLVVKKRDGRSWQLFVLDLATMTEQALNQGPGSVDDQVEWLDNAHVVYHDATENGTGIWSLAIDGVTTPRLLVADAYSPSVQQ
jgi:hypothetical protein